MQIKAKDSIYYTDTEFSAWIYCMNVRKLASQHILANQ
jgi:hypothetical protein